MSDNPYQSPASTELADFSAGEFGGSAPAKLGMLVWTVLILDSPGCLARLYYGLYSAIGYYPRGVHLDSLDVFVMFAAFPLGIGLFGLSGNMLILLKKKVGIPLAIVSTLFVPLLNVYMIGISDTGPQLDYWLVLAAMLIQICWAIFYGAVVWIAARRLRRTVGTVQGR